MVKNKEIQRLIGVVETNIDDLENQMAELHLEINEILDELENNKEALKELKKL